MNITFLGATDTVTGSKYLLRENGATLLVDCGLFQGYKHLRERNWRPLPVDPAEIDAVLLTHAHVDHSGYLPLLVRDGFRGPIYATGATRDLCAVLLPDSGRLQEESARFANKRGFSKHHPALPLYTEEDAEAALPHFRVIAFGQTLAVGGGIRARFSRAGHILGAASVRVESERASILFSGDLGRPSDPIMLAPDPPPAADCVVVESTYGDRLHDRSDPARQLANIVDQTVRRGGILLVPAFAVGRAQELLYYLYVLRERNEIPDVPVYLDSPMAERATRLLADHVGEHRLDAQVCERIFGFVRFASTPEESKALSRSRGPMVVISASGMATGGRVLHHLKAFAPEARNTVLFAGFQAGGTRGASMVAGATSVKIHGEYVPIHAEVARLDTLSAHADSGEVLDWLSRCPTAPGSVFVTHGEPAAADALRLKIGERFAWRCSVPDYGQSVTLG